MVFTHKQSKTIYIGTDLRQIENNKVGNSIVQA
jgi:hypothetical protein